MDTFQHAISIIEKGTAKNPCILAEGNRHKEPKTTSGQLSSEGRPQGQEPSANIVNDGEAFHRTDHRRHTRKHSRSRWDRPVPLKDKHSEQWTMLTTQPTT